MLKYFFPLLTLVFACTDENDTQTVVEQPETRGYWYEKPLRIQQTVLREPDAADYPVDSVITYLNSTHANVLVINGGGIVDYFQNTLPLANVNEYMGDRDLLKEIVTACHENDIKVIARVDFRGVEKYRYDQHPDWFAENDNGDPIILNYTTPGLYAPCYNSYYRNDHAVEFISKLFEEYQVDGIWHNAVNFYQTCYCPHCQRKFSEKYGKDIPAESSPEQDWEEYFRWKDENADEQLALMRETVKNYGEDKAYTGEVFNMYDVEQQKHTGIDLYSAAEYFDFLVTVSFIADNRVNVEYKDIHYASTIVKFLKSLDPDKSPVILFGGNGTEHRYIYDPPVDLKLWLWEAAASGGGYWNCYFNGAYPAATLDVRNAFLHRKAYQYLASQSGYIQGLEPVKDVAVFFSKASGQFLGDEDFALPIKGMIRMLQEEHYQYGFLNDRDLSRESLDPYKVLILPNVPIIKEEHASLIRNWVNEGGKLIATYETSLYNESGAQREEFLLADLFGTHFTGEVANTQMDCYQKILQRNAILKGFEETDLIHNGGMTLLTAKDQNTLGITGYLPRVNNQPPEYAYPEDWDTEYPVIMENTYGQGTVIYFANQPGLLNYTVGHPDYQDVLSNAIKTLLDKETVLSTNAPSGVHVYLNKSRKDESLYVLSLVNTNSGTHRPFRDLVPVYDITVELPFPIASGELISEGEIQFEIQENQIHLDKLEDFGSIMVRRE